MDRDGNLYAGCGPEGIVYRVRSDGQGRVEAYFDTRDSNVLSLAMDSGGKLLAATGGKGRIFRIDEPGRARVIHDFEDREVRSITIREDVVYAATNMADEAPGTSGESSGKATEFSTLGRNLARKFQGFEFIQGNPADDEPGSSRMNLNIPAGSRGGEVVVLHPDGRVQTLHEIHEGFLMDLAMDGIGNLYVGLGYEGRVISLGENGQWTLLSSTSGALVSTLAAGATGLKFAACSNPGTLTTWAPGVKATHGSFTSRPHDANVVSRWGNVEAAFQGDVTIVTRSGNTSIPDPTWSSWETAGPGLPGPIVSPPGRFLQLQVAWKNDPLAQLGSLKAYYLNENQIPRIESFSMGDTSESRKTETPDRAKVTTGSGPLEQALGRIGLKSDSDPKPARTSADSGESVVEPRSGGSGKVEFSWRARDIDGDHLVYRLSYRPLPGSPWLPMTGKDALEKSEFTWDTSSVPDGHHFVRLEVSDERSNPPGDHQTATKEISPVIVDNGRPKVVGLAFDRETRKVTGTARDEMSPIRRLEYQVDGDEWRVFFPKDRLLDSSLEEFDFQIGPLDDRAHVIGVRAIDREGNVGLSIVVIGEKS